MPVVSGLVDLMLHVSTLVVRRLSTSLCADFLWSFVRGVSTTTIVQEGPTFLEEAPTVVLEDPLQAAGGGG